MLKQYVYSAREAGLTEWPSGTLRLNLEVTENPDEADVFVCPGPLLLFQKRTDLERFPYISGREDRHVFFDCSDWDTVYSNRNPILIRCNLKRFMLEAHPNSISWPWPVEDFTECINTPEGGFKFDISFQGWLSSEARIKSKESCANSAVVQSDIATYLDFCGYIYDTPEGIRRRREFRRSMKESRIALCPESIPGCLPYRFLEAMSAGRIPLLVGSDYNLPFAAEIPYDDFIIRCPASDAANAAQYAVEFISRTPDERIVDKGIEARYYWDKYLNRDNWPALMTYAVQKKLAMPAAV